MYPCETCEHFCEAENACQLNPVPLPEAGVAVYRVKKPGVRVGEWLGHCTDSSTRRIPPGFTLAGAGRKKGVDY